MIQARISGAQRCQIRTDRLAATLAEFIGGEAGIEPRELVYHHMPERLRGFELVTQTGFVFYDSGLGLRSLYVDDAEVMISDFALGTDLKI